MSPTVPASRRWRWRRPAGISRWEVWIAPLDGQLGEDGGTVEVGRTSRVGTCRSCGQRAALWQAFLILPVPLPMLGPVGRGCSPDHACAHLPADCGWQFIAAKHAAIAAATRRGSDGMPPDERTAAWAARHAERAAWLAGQPADARQLARQIWEDNDELSVADVDVLVSGTLAAPGE